MKAGRICHGGYKDGNNGPYVRDFFGNCGRAQPLGPDFPSPSWPNSKSSRSSPQDLEIRLRKRVYNQDADGGYGTWTSEVQDLSDVSPTFLD